MRHLSDEVKSANIEYHTKLADTYDKEQPYFSPENTERVDAIIKELAKRHGNGRLLDIGCGTGFILNIAKKYFNKVVGIDVTQAMLDKVDLSSGNVEVVSGDCSDMRFSSGSFNVCTAYSVLHHLSSLTPTLRGVYRCLKSGGAFYVDQEPNYYCWREVRRLFLNGHIEGLLKREIESICVIPNGFVAEHGLKKETVRLAEYGRFLKCGMRTESIEKKLKSVGFTSVSFDYQWYLGEGYVLHSISQEREKEIGDIMRALLPMSRAMFKYISFVAVKYG